jgi:hypothetical protein
MPSVISRRDLQAVQKLPFCYVCGKRFTANDQRNRDHVPSRSCISLKDRPQSPVILPVHVGCNNLFKIADERVGQFLSLLHGKLAKAEKRRLQYRRFSNPALHSQSRQIEAVSNVNMYGTVWRWVRAFHAALYQQPIPQEAKYAIELPFQVVSPIGDSYIIDDGRPRQRSLCEETINRNRMTRTTDRLVGWNGQLQYECVWVLTPMNAYCVFWLDFYEWRRLANLSGHNQKDCVGFYHSYLSEVPTLATIESQVIAKPGSRSRFL